MSSPAAGILLSELRHVVAELDQLLGAPVQDAWVPTSDCVFLQAGRRLLRIERYPHPRVHLATHRPANPKTPRSFQGLLRARLRGPITAIRLVGDDRAVEVEVGPLVLHARLFGRGGGIWLLEGERVLGAVDGPAPLALPPLPEGAGVAQPPRFQPRPGQTWNEAAELWLDAQEEAWELDRWSRHVRRGLTRRAQRQRKLVANLEGDLARVDGADALRQQADSLAAALHRVPRGAAAATVDDVHHPGRQVTIPLDPARAPAESLRRLYDKASRLERSGERVLERLTQEEQRLATLEEDRASVDEADVAALQRLARRWELGPPDVRAQEAAGPPTPWIRWTGPEGDVVLVGRNERSNRALTFQHARGRDWWFHLRDRPGAHVVLRRDPRTPPPLELLLAAAQLVVRYARVPPGETADVQYARVSDLRPLPDRGAAGVAITREKVLHVRRDDEALRGWSQGDAPWSPDEGSVP